MNLLVREDVAEVFGNHDRINIIDPLEVLDFHTFLNRSNMILSDSGGIKEEASLLGKPVLVIRDITARTKRIKAGTLKKKKLFTLFLKSY